MRVEIEDVLFWMDAIRNSSDRYRTLESFWKGQVNSKIWLIETLQRILPDEPVSIVIHGGWNGVLSSLLFNSKMDIKHITSVDIDPNCREIAYTVNKRHEIAGVFCAVTSDMCNYKYSTLPSIVVNTSCEHVTPEQYDQWLSNIPTGTTVVVQSNNYFELDEHVNCKNSLEEFIASVGFNAIHSAKLVLPKYDRYMVIGKKL